MSRNKFNLPPGLPGNEFDKSEATYTQERFNAVEVSGKEGNATTTYNKYTIGGKELIFRSYNEVPAIDGPAKWLNRADVTPMMTSAVENASNIVSSESEDAVLVVPTSPEGIISAVQEVSGDSTAFADLLNEDGSFSTSEKAKTFLDSMIASTLFDDDGNERTAFESSNSPNMAKCLDNGDGFALLVAGMAGDSEAMRIVNDKIGKYYEVMDSEESDARERISRRATLESEGGREALAKNEVLLVHSTSHDIERDENGNVMLYAASAKRPDRIPRSSIHFTANGEVESHPMGSWSDSNKLIVANFEDVHEANGNPRIMSEVDTWYTLNPQEGLTLPNARVVEPSQLENGVVLEKDGDAYRYHAAESYTPNQIKHIQELASRYKVSVGDDYSKTLREISLRAAGGELGVDRYIDIQSHYSADQEFNDRYGKLANELGVQGGLHDNTAEARQEANFAPSMKVSLEANRTLAWSGALAMKTAKQEAALELPGFGGGLI